MLTFLIFVVSLQQSNAFQQTGMSVMGMDAGATAAQGDNTAHLKGKLANLNETVR